MEEKIGQTEQKTEARVKMVEDAAERNKRKERKARKKAEEEPEPVPEKRARRDSTNSRRSPGLTTGWKGTTPWPMETW